MPPCASTKCTSTLPSASQVAGEADPAMKPEVVATICFGLIMFLLAVLALWQGRKQLRRPATKGIPTCCWPRPLNTTVLIAVDKLPPHRSSLSWNNCLEAFPCQIEPRGKVASPLPLPPIPTHSSEACLQLPAPIYARQMGDIRQLSARSKQHSTDAVPATTEVLNKVHEICRAFLTGRCKDDSEVYE